MTFNRHREIYPSDEDASRTSVLAHRLDEFPAGYSLAGCAPAAPASASPTVPEYALKSSCRPMFFHRTVNSVLTLCLTPGDRPKMVLEVSLRYAHLRQETDSIHSLQELLAKTVAVCGDMFSEKDGAEENSGMSPSTRVG